MIERRVVVVRREPDHLWVAAETESACGACAHRSGCGTGAINRWLSGRQRLLRVAVPREPGADPRPAPVVGDTVTIGIEESALVHSALALYLVPIVAMLVSAVLGRALAPPGWADGVAAAAAVAGLLAGLGLNRSRLFADRFGRWQPVLLDRAAAPRAVAGRTVSLLP